MIQIITDTASDITMAEAEELGVLLVKLRVSFPEAAYSQEQDDSFEQFYRLLEESRGLPTTSQPTPAEYLALFAAAKESKDSVVVIALSGNLSGTVQSAAIAKEMCGYDDIYIIDSKQAIIGQRLLVEYAVRLREEGRSAAQITATITDAVDRVRLFGALDTLKYLRKGGRIPKSTEVVGSVLGIKPLVELKNGSIEMAGKARGHAGAVTGMVKLVQADAHFDDSVPVYFGYTHTRQLCTNFRKIATQKFHLTKTRQCPVGSIVGTHVGPGAFAIAYLVK